MKAVCQLIGLVLLATLALMVLGAAVFIGGGALLSQWLPLSLFHASSLTIGATLAVAFVIYALTTVIHFHSTHMTDNDLEWENDDTEDDQMPVTEPKMPTVGRNAPCPCGSGRKFKFCCGQSPEK